MAPSRNRHITAWASLAAVPLTMVLLAATAGAQAFDLGQLEGRWQDERRDLMLDIGRCGPGICGVLVTAKQACGAEALTATISVGPRPVDRPILGKLTLPGKNQTYSVQLSLYSITAVGNPRPELMIQGDVGEYSFVQRTFPFTAQLARIGPAACPIRTTS